MGNSKKSNATGHSSKKSKKDNHHHSSSSSSAKKYSYSEAGPSTLERYVYDAQPNERFAIGQSSERPTGQHMVQQWGDTWRNASGGGR